MTPLPKNPVPKTPVPMVGLGELEEDMNKPWEDKLDEDMCNHRYANPGELTHIETKAVVDLNTRKDVVAYKDMLARKWICVQCGYVSVEELCDIKKDEPEKPKPFFLRWCYDPFWSALVYVSIFVAGLLLLFEIMGWDY